MTIQTYKDVGKKFTMPVVLAGLLLSGCSTPQPKVVVGLDECPTPCIEGECPAACLAKEVEQQQSLLEAKEQQLREKEQEIANLEFDFQEALERERAEGRATVTASTGTLSSPVGMMPPEARPGQCYTRVFIPPTFRKEEKRIPVTAAGTRKKLVTDTQYEWTEREVVVKERGEEIRVTPPEYDWVEEQVLVKEASERIEVISKPTYEWVEETIMVKEGSERIKVIPAVMGWEEEQVLVEEGSERIEVVRKPEYEWVEKKVLVEEAVVKTRVVPAITKVPTKTVLEKPPHKVWKKCPSVTQRIEGQTGDVMCLVEVPAKYKEIPDPDGDLIIVRPESVDTIEVSKPKYKTIRVRTLKTPAQTRVVPIPPKYKTVRTQVVKKPATTVKEFVEPEYKTIRKRVLKEPAQVRVVPIPPEYKTVRRRVLKTPAQVHRVDTPEETQRLRVRVKVADAEIEEVPVEQKFSVVTTQVKVSEGQTKWQLVECKLDLSEEVIKETQRALRRQGFNPGTTTGRLTPETEQTIIEYQRASGLPQDGRITFELLEALEVKDIQKWCPTR